MRNRLLIKNMNMLCFIYINCRSIRAATKQRDNEAELLEELMTDLLLNQEDDLVQYDTIDGGDNDEDSWEDMDPFIDDVLMA